MIDFSDFVVVGTQAQASEKRLPLPVEAVGSILMCDVNLEPSPRFAPAGNPQLSMTRSGLIQLPLILTVCSGKFTGRCFFCNITLPEQFQTASLTDSQRKACRIGGQTICKLLLTAAGFAPNDTSASALSMTKLNDWSGINGKRVPVEIGEFNGHPTIKAIIGITDRQSEAVYKSGEILTDKARAWEWSPTKAAQTAIPSQPFSGFGGNDDIPF